MVKIHTPLLAAMALAAFTLPGLACGAHPEGHAALTTASTEQAPAVVMPKPKAVKEEAAMSVPEPAGFMNCNRRNKDQTVYLTQ